MDEGPESPLPLEYTVTKKQVVMNRCGQELKRKSGSGKMQPSMFSIGHFIETKQIYCSKG
jgi:hypothetical protein